MKFFAHSTESTDKSDWQRLSAHLLATGDGAAARAAFFGGQALAQICGQLHDLGKYTEQFQARLAGEVPKVDHATWGAHIAAEQYGGLGTLMAYAIAGHHAGLANGADGEKRSSLRERLGEDYRRALPTLLPDWQNEITLPSSVVMPEGFRANRERLGFQMQLLTRMVFSCLVDADFIDTDNFYRSIEGKPPRTENTGPSLRVLRERLDAYLVDKPKTGGINPLRADILREVRARASLDCGLFSLTVPTGGGKTLASLAFALDHAIAHGLRRVIYVIPFTSIVEQTATVFREAFGDLGEDAVLEHHSAFFDDPHYSPESIEKRHLAMQNWDSPIVVTTAVQFFESLFADRPSRCRKLHNIAGSVVILDEAQTFPLKLLHPCVALLEELARNYRASLVLCTATQPALTAEKGFTSGLENVRELAPDPLALYQQLRRVSVRHVGKLDDEQLTEHLRGREQVLCIVNNRRHARQVFESMDDQSGAYHLSTLMHARHRSKILDAVRRRLKAGEPCRLVSTSLIEAGVDVDFPTVLRAEAGLDSIVQAAGRCNREGRQPSDASEVLVFQPGNPDWVPPKELKQFAEAFRAIERKHHDDLLALEAVTSYFQEVYWRKEGNLGDALSKLMNLAALDSLPLETLAAKFKLIETTMRPVVVPYDPEAGMEDTYAVGVLRDLEFAPGAARKLQSYLVQVPERAYQALWQAHALQAVAPEKYGEQFVRLVNPRLYDSNFGLHWENPQELRSDSTLW